MTPEADYFPPSSGPLSILTRSIAMLRQDPEQLQHHAGLRFRTGHDDLDQLDWAEVVGISGRRYALVRHRHSPQTGTEIVTSQDSMDPQSDIRDVLNGLDLRDQDLIWTAPDLVSRRRHSIKRARDKDKTPRRTFVRMRHRGGVRLRLRYSDLRKLRKPVRGHGGFQSLLRKLQKQIDGTELHLSAEDVERLVRYSAAYGSGGFQVRTPNTVRSSKKATKKR